MAEKTVMEQLAEALQAQNTPAKKVSWDKLDVEIEHSGRAITLPDDPGKMPIPKAIEALQRKLADEEQDFALYEILDGFPHDALVALVKAMQKLYGWASPVPTPGFFGPQPPSMLSVKTGHRDEDVVQCPQGRFKVPGVSQPINTQFDRAGKNGAWALVVHGTFKKKERHILLELANLARSILKAESIYRGKAIRIAVDMDGEMDVQNPPEFMDVSDTTEASLIFDTDIQAMIDTNILVPIKQTDLCRKHKIPLKRGVLLEGPYGTGKSLCARMVAATCERNGWTFVLLDRVQGLRQALEFANRYSPAVVFAEDIDRIAATRDEQANDLINTIDGVVSKRSEIMTVLTTNFVEKLNPVILRPGRLDAVISLRAPSDEAVGRLLVSYAGKLLPEGMKTPKASRELSGQIPASIREAVERAKMGMIGRQAVTLSDDDLYVAAKTMKTHLALLNRDQKVQTHAEKLFEALQAAVNGHKAASEVGANSRDTHENRLSRIEGNTEEILSHVN